MACERLPGRNDRKYRRADVLASGRWLKATRRETHPQFSQRMQRVEDHLNSDDFAAPDGNGLLGLAKELRGRCKTVVQLKGERVPK